MKSIDYAVVERTKLAAVMPADLGSVWDELVHDPAGNATDGPVVVVDIRNNLVRSEEPMRPPQSGSTMLS